VFSDRATINVQGGRGGDGCISFRREKYVPRGGPNGGDGGHGGDVELIATDELRDLSKFRFASHFKGERGTHGQGSGKHGRGGGGVQVEVPVGTQVWLRDEGTMLADLAHPGARAVVARGGGGGAGNRRYATSTHRAPTIAELGELGDDMWLELRLKLVADAALLGFPNAGKSSLLRRISNAKPKVADYPFTTIEPVLGTVELPDGGQLTVADVPGLLEGASQGVGLGDEFLAHLERARLLIHLVEADPDPEEIARRRDTINRELALHGGGLAERPQLLVLSKIDTIPPEDHPGLVEATGTRLGISSVTGEGIEELSALLFELVPGAPAVVLEPAAGEQAELADFLVYRPRPPQRREFKILRDAGILRVAGRAIERLAAPLDPADGNDVAKLAAELERMGVDEALRAAGAKAGDEILVGTHSFNYEPAPDPETVA
jgi:GTP-binding protein